MTLITKILTPFLEVKKWLFGKPVEVAPTWQNDPFYEAKKSLAAAILKPSWFGKMEAERERLNGLTDAQRKNEKLVALARYIVVAIALKKKKQAQKKRHSHIVKGIETAQRERLEIETGKRVYDPAFGAWVVKGEK